MKEAGTQPESRAPKREVQGSASLDAAGSGTGGSGAVARIRAVHGLVLSRNSFGKDFVKNCSLAARDPWQRPAFRFLTSLALRYLRIARFFRLPAGFWVFTNCHDVRSRSRNTSSRILGSLTSTDG